MLAKHEDGGLTPDVVTLEALTHLLFSSVAAVFPHWKYAANAKDSLTES